MYTESTALLTALDWTGLVWTGSGGKGTHQMRLGVGGWGQSRVREEPDGLEVGWERSKWDAAIIKATQTACRYSHRKHRHHHHIAFQSLA